MTRLHDIMKVMRQYGIKEDLNLFVFTSGRVYLWLDLRL